MRGGSRFGDSVLAQGEDEFDFADAFAEALGDFDGGEAFVGEAVDVHADGVGEARLSRRSGYGLRGAVDDLPRFNFRPGCVVVVAGGAWGGGGGGQARDAVVSLSDQFLEPGGLCVEVSDKPACEFLGFDDGVLDRTPGIAVGAGVVESFARA